MPNLQFVYVSFFPLLLPVGDSGKLLFLLIGRNVKMFPVIPFSSVSSHIRLFPGWCKQFNQDPQVYVATFIDEALSLNFFSSAMTK